MNTAVFAYYFIYYYNSIITLSIFSPADKGTMTHKINQVVSRIVKAYFYWKKKLY